MTASAHASSGGADRGPADRHSATGWPEARRIARQAGRAGDAVRRPLAEAFGQVLAEPLPALTDLPSFDTSAMDGWAVAGPGPWRLDEADAVLAGHPGGLLPDGTAVPIATGAALPPGATAVLRREHGRTEHRGGTARLYTAQPHPQPEPGRDVRPRGQECRTGDQLLPGGTPVTPAVLGLAAAAGYDELPVVPRPRVHVLVLGDELLHHGLPQKGLVRDALGPLLVPWLRSLGADVDAVRHLGDDADLLHRTLSEAASAADLVITTGGTAAGPVDFVHPVLRRLGAELLVDGVAVRPGHPMLLARLPGGPLLAGLPGNPLAAVSGMLTLAAPALLAIGGRPESGPRTATLTEDVPGHPTDTRLLPVAFQDGTRQVRPLRFHGPAMLRGLAAADGLAVVVPGGIPAGGSAEILETGWRGGGWS